MTAIEVKPLGGIVGAEVLGVDAEQLASDAQLARVARRRARDVRRARVPRPAPALPSSRSRSAVTSARSTASNGNHEVEGIYRVSLDRTNRSSASYLRGTFAWHVDGCTPDGDEYPQMATVLTAKTVAEQGGETEFASSYGAYEELTTTRRRVVRRLRVVHSLEASQRRVRSDPTPKQLAAWRSRPPHEHPLVWTHRNGRRSLLIGASADHVVGMDLDEGRALLDELLARATVPERVYRHEWSVGDTVIWDNRGVLHRAAPYDPTSGREMLRTTILGDEPIQ